MPATEILQRNFPLYFNNISIRNIKLSFKQPSSTVKS
jgi:hypothetical protein